MKDILVSLVIPAYNVENLISMTLDSVINQTLSNFECIVVDDFSKDNTKEVIQQYLKKDKRIKLISHRANAGLSAARNTGLRNAKGKYVAFLDSDDLIMPESLELRAKTLEDNLDESVVGTYAGSLTISMDCKIPPAGAEVKLKVIDFITASGNCPFNANQPMFKTNLFKKFGGFDHSLKQAEDYDMWMRILRCGMKIIPTNKQLVTYRQTEGSMIRDNPLLHLDTSYKRFIECYQDYPTEKWNEKFNVNLRFGLDRYLSELNISNRVLEFVGLGLAKGENNEVLLQRLCSYLPSYFDALESHRAFLPHVKKGIDRYFKCNVNFADKKYSSLKDKLDKLYQEFKDAAKAGNAEKKSFNVDGINQNNIVSSTAMHEKFEIIFIPHKDYHVHAISLMAPFLKELGLNFVIVDISMHYRDEGVARACDKYNLLRVGYSNFVLGNFKPKALVVFNDWDPIVRSIVNAAKSVGIATVGIVEGIQDYLDADTKQQRFAYKNVQHLFLPGEHDRKYFADSSQNIYIGGIPRIFEMRKEKIQKRNSKNKIALINSNFSYGVLEEHRDSWLASAVEAVEEVGFKPVISRHPADKGTLFEEYVSKRTFYEELKDADVVISRFASGMLEALAYKVLPIYYNPHGEKVDKFAAPLGAYPVVNDKHELNSILMSFDKVKHHCHFKFDAFLDFHTGEGAENPSLVISGQLNDIVSSVRCPEFSYSRFFSNLEVVDLNTGCFNNIAILRNSEYESWFFRDDLSVSMVYKCIKARDYTAASKIAAQLLKSDTSNPAYLNVHSLVNKLLKISGKT